MASDVNEMSSFSSFLVVVYYFFYLFYCIGTSIGIWKSAGNYIGVNLLKRSDFEDVAKELDQIPELQGLSFRRDCKEENANIKLNTMYIRTLVCRQKLIDIYFARRNSNKNQKIN